MKINARGVALIKEYEGLRLNAYKCPGGELTIGYGHTSAAGSPKVVPGMKITADEAGEILKDDLRHYEDAVAGTITKYCNENQFSAMVSLCYNIGPGAFRKSSVARYFNDGQAAKAANSFLLWTKADGKELKGLIRRRAAELALFNTPVQNVIPPRPLPPDRPDVHTPPELPPAAPASKPLSIQQVMIGIIAAAIAAIAAYFFGVSR